jgi:hypothetical protein
MHAINDLSFTMLCDFYDLFNRSCKSRLSSRHSYGLKCGIDTQPQTFSAGDISSAFAVVSATGSFPRMRYEIPRK